MQLARDRSLPRDCKFYPSHEAGTHLSTNHYRIGVFWHPYDTRDRNAPFESIHLPKSGRMPVSFWRDVVERRARFRQPQGLENSKYFEFADYEASYGTSTPLTQMRAYQPPGLGLIPAVFVAPSNPATNPVGFVSDVLRGFVRFYEPDSVFTRDDWNRINDLSGSVLGAQYQTGFGPNGDLDIVSAMLAAKANKLSSDDLATGMRLLAEKVVERAAIAAKTPAELGIPADAKKHELDYLDDFIGRILDVRRGYLKTGDIAPDDEMFAGFDSQQDADEDVSKTPKTSKLKFTDAEKQSTRFMIERLRKFVADTSPKPTEIDQVAAQLRALDAAIGRGQPTDAQRKEKFKLNLRYAQLSSQGFAQARQSTTTKINDIEKAHVAIQRKIKAIDGDLKTLLEQIDNAQKEVNAAREALTEVKGVKAKKTAQANIKQKTTQQEVLESQLSEKKREGLAEQGKGLQLRINLQKLASELGEVDEAVQTPPAVRRLFANKRGTKLYERAVSLAMADLVERELASFDYPAETRGKRRAEVEDAISTIENVRVQLPSGSERELSRFSGLGTLPFALSSTSSSLSVADVNAAPHPQTQVAISELVRGT